MGTANTASEASWTARATIVSTPSQAKTAIARPVKKAARETGWETNSSRRPLSSSLAVALLANRTPAAAKQRGMTSS